MIGAPDMAFPRLNALSYWLLPVAGHDDAAVLPGPRRLVRQRLDGLRAAEHLGAVGQTFFTIGVQFAGASSIATALNFLVTIITMRAPGMSFFRMPLLVWANFSTSLLVVIATPFIAASQFFVLLDRAWASTSSTPAQGGDVLMYQHVFWFYSHPAVYIMMLPGFGIISEILAVKARKPIFGYRMMAFSLLAIVVLGFTVWAHHMFVSGMQPWIRVPMMVTTAIIAVPRGSRSSRWLATLWRGRAAPRHADALRPGFITMFSCGGISGVMLAMIPVTIHVSDTYFIVAHIHYVLFGGSLFTIFAGVYYWFPKMTGRMYDERLGKLHFWMTFIFFNLTFGPMHIIGVAGMPRRVYDYADKFANWNLLHLDLLVRARAEHARLRLQHGRLVARRPAGRGEPLARADARVAGLLAPADLQVRRHADGRRRPVRIRRPRRGPRDLRPAPRRSAPRPRAPRPTQRRGRRGAPCQTILVVANETLGGRRCWAIKERGRGRDMRFIVCVAADEPAHGNVIFDDAVFDAAQVRIDLARKVLREEGITAVGEVGDPDPYTATMDAIAEYQPDEVLISTFPAAPRAGCAAT